MLRSKVLLGRCGEARREGNGKGRGDESGLCCYLELLCCYVKKQQQQDRGKCELALATTNAIFLFFVIFCFYSPTDPSHSAVVVGGALLRLFVVVVVVVE